MSISSIFYVQIFWQLFYVHVTKEKLPKRHSYEKFVRKMLMKLTPDRKWTKRKHERIRKGKRKRRRKKCGKFLLKRSNLNSVQVFESRRVFPLNQKCNNYYDTFFDKKTLEQCCCCCCWRGGCQRSKHYLWLCLIMSCFILSRSALSNLVANRHIR